MCISSLLTQYDVDTAQEEKATTGSVLSIDPKVQELLEATKLQPAHLKHVLITGAGFFCDSYGMKRIEWRGTGHVSVSYMWLLL